MISKRSPVVERFRWLSVVETIRAQRNPVIEQLAPQERSGCGDSDPVRTGRD
ncbi:MAG: hypothetical protein RBR28_08405 [Lentimicrobium sp.]|nr:hypothetical protein [Lentimicrobium sp.]